LQGALRDGTVDAVERESCRTKEREDVVPGSGDHHLLARDAARHLAHDVREARTVDIEEAAVTGIIRRQAS
jgi:hypothetical protein